MDIFPGSNHATGESDHQNSQPHHHHPSSFVNNNTITNHSTTTSSETTSVTFSYSHPHCDPSTVPPTGNYHETRNVEMRQSQTQNDKSPKPPNWRRNNNMWLHDEDGSRDHADGGSTTKITPVDLHSFCQNRYKEGEHNNNMDVSQGIEPPPPPRGNHSGSARKNSTYTAEAAPAVGQHVENENDRVARQTSCDNDTVSTMYSTRKKNEQEHDECRMNGSRAIPRYKKTYDEETRNGYGNSHDQDNEDRAHGAELSVPDNQSVASNVAHPYYGPAAGGYFLPPAPYHPFYPPPPHYYYPYPSSAVVPPHPSYPGYSSSGVSTNATTTTSTNTTLSGAHHHGGWMYPPLPPYPMMASAPPPHHPTTTPQFYPPPMPHHHPYAYGTHPFAPPPHSPEGMEVAGDDEDDEGNKSSSSANSAGNHAGATFRNENDAMMISGAVDEDNHNMGYQRHYYSATTDPRTHNSEVAPFVPYATGQERWSSLTGPHTNTISRHHGDFRHRDDASTSSSKETRQLYVSGEVDERQQDFLFMEQGSNSKNTTSRTSYDKTASRERADVSTLAIENTTKGYTNNTSFSNAIEKKVCSAADDNGSTTKKYISSTTTRNSNILGASSSVFRREHNPQPVTDEQHQVNHPQPAPPPPPIPLFPNKGDHYVHPNVPNHFARPFSYSNHTSISTSSSGGGDLQQRSDTFDSADTSIFFDRRERKNAQSRIRAQKLKEAVDVIKAKRPEDRTDEEKLKLIKYEDRRLRKNRKLREKAHERKMRYEKLCVKSKDELTQDDKMFIKEVLAAKSKKNKADKLRRKRMKETDATGSGGDGRNSIATSGSWRSSTREVTTPVASFDGTPSSSVGMPFTNPYYPPSFAVPPPPPPQIEMAEADSSNTGSHQNPPPFFYPPYYYPPPPFSTDHHHREDAVAQQQEQQGTEEIARTTRSGAGGEHNKYINHYWRPQEEEQEDGHDNATRSTTTRHDSYTSNNTSSSPMVTSTSTSNQPHNQHQQYTTNRNDQDFSEQQQQEQQDYQHHTNDQGASSWQREGQYNNSHHHHDNNDESAFNNQVDPTTQDSRIPITPKKSNHKKTSRQRASGSAAADHDNDGDSDISLNFSPSIFDEPSTSNNKTMPPRFIGRQSPKN